MADDIYDLTGRKFSGELRVTLKPGFGILGPNGEHLEGGPHVLPLRIAQDLLTTNRADLSDGPVEEKVVEKEGSKPTTGLTTESISQRDPVVESRDPAAPAAASRAVAGSGKRKR